MIYSEVIIVGGGPAGSTCGWKLNQVDIECIILDKKSFPRLKVCAGWITPKVVKLLEINSGDYPHSLLSFDSIYFHIYGSKLKIKTLQYSIRRYEFDIWLLERSRVPVHNHQVLNISKDGEYYIIDDQFRCKYLIGAAGTYCPVYKTFFQDINPRNNNSLITAMQDEFPSDWNDKNCHLWFFKNNLPGYAWYFPKGNGFLNVGIGGLSVKLKERKDSISKQWGLFTRMLDTTSMVASRHYDPKGYNYYLRQNVKTIRVDNAFIIGDSVGLATKDMGEGIGPSVESGIRAANSIIDGTTYTLESIAKYSTWSIMTARFRRLHTL